MGKGEHDSFFFPSRDAVGLTVGHQGNRLFETHDNRLAGPSVSRRAEYQDESSGCGADHALVMSRPDIVPVEEANFPASIPIRTATWKS